MGRSIKCPHCGQVMKIGEEAAGKRVDCPACKKAFRAPQALAAAPPEKPAKPSPAAPKPLAAAPPAPAQPPPAAAGRVWFFHVDGRNDGPHAAETVLEQVKTGRLDADTLVWKDGMGDWQPLREVADFRGAFATPPPVKPSHAHRPHPPKPGEHLGRGHEGEHEPRAHYSRAKARRDMSIGLWVAGALGLAALIALLLLLNRREERPAPRQDEVSRVDTSMDVQPAPEVVVDTKGTPTPPPKKAPKAEPTREKLLTTLAAEMDAGFRAAIEAHKKGKAAPIIALTRKCKSNAEKLAQRDWGIYKDEVDALAKSLAQAGDGMYTIVQEKAAPWGSDGTDEKTRAKLLELDKYEWISNWQKIIADHLDRVRKKGLNF